MTARLVRLPKIPWSEMLIGHKNKVGQYCKMVDHHSVIRDDNMDGEQHSIQAEKGKRDCEVTTDSR